MKLPPPFKCFALVNVTRAAKPKFLGEPGPMLFYTRRISASTKVLCSRAPMLRGVESKKLARVIKVVPVTITFGK